MGKKTFELVWGLIDEQRPPEPKHRRLALGKLAAALVAALVLEGERSSGCSAVSLSMARVTASLP